MRSHRSSHVPEINRLVLETLEPLPGDRKCFRMINGVLVERTVKDVVPALQTNAEGLKKVLDDLVKQYKTKQDDLEKWKVSKATIPPPPAPPGPRHCMFGDTKSDTPRAEEEQRSGCSVVGFFFLGVMGGQKMRQGIVLRALEGELPCHQVCIAGYCGTADT